MAERLAALVICPGRGTYGKAELGYLKRLHADKAELIERLRPAARRARPADHLRARRRRALQPGTAHARRHRLAADLHRLLCRFPRHRPVALRHRRGHRQFDGLVHDARRRRRGRAPNTASRSSTRWARTARPASPAARSCSPSSTRNGARCRACARPCSASSRRSMPGPDAALYLSIELGGMMVFAGNEAGLAALLAEAPPTPGARAAPPRQSRPLPHPADAGLVGPRPARLPADWFGAPDVPMIDGRGHIWRPFASDAEALRALHLRHPDPRNLRFHPRRPGRGARICARPDHPARPRRHARRRHRPGADRDRMARPALEARTSRRCRRPSRSCSPWAARTSARWSPAKAPDKLRSCTANPPALHRARLDRLHAFGPRPPRDDEEPAVPRPARLCAGRHPHRRSPREELPHPAPPRRRRRRPDRGIAARPDLGGGYDAVASRSCSRWRWSMPRSNI